MNSRTSLKYRTPRIQRKPKGGKDYTGLGIRMPSDFSLQKDKGHKIPKKILDSVKP